MNYSDLKGTTSFPPNDTITTKTTFTITIKQQFPHYYIFPRHYVCAQCLTDAPSRAR